MRIFKSRHTPLIALLLCMAVQAALTLCYAITLHYQLKTSGFDGMVYEQLFHNLLSGNGFTSSINPPYNPQFWLGFHFSPILYLITPFYYLFPHIETLLTIGCISVALAAYPIFLTARYILEDAFQALMIALLYLINPFVFNGALWDFHEVDFAPLCIAWMLWTVVTRKRGQLLVLSLVLMSIKEHYGLSVAGFGLLWAWHWKEAKFGLGLAALGIAMLAVIFAVIIPHFNPMGVPTMMNEASPEDRFSWIMSWAGIEAHWVSALTDALWYLLKLLLPLLFLPLGAFMWLLPALADLAVDSMSLQLMMRSFLSYHTMALIPLLLIALCQAIKKYVPSKKSNDVMLAVIVASVCLSYMQLALPFSEMGNAWELSAPQFDYSSTNRKAIDDINVLIPHDAPIAAQVNVLPHLKPRYEMTAYPFAGGNADIIVLHFGFPFKRALSLFGTPFGDSPTSKNRYFSSVESLLHDKSWGITYHADRWVVLQKNMPDQANARPTALKDFATLQEEYKAVVETIRESYRKQP